MKTRAQEHLERVREQSPLPFVRRQVFYDDLDDMSEQRRIVVHREEHPTRHHDQSLPQTTSPYIDFCNELKGLVYGRDVAGSSVRHSDLLPQVIPQKRELQEETEGQGGACSAKRRDESPSNATAHKRLCEEPRDEAHTEDVISSDADKDGTWDQKMRESRNILAALMTSKPEHADLLMNHRTVGTWMPGDWRYRDVEERRKRIVKKYGSIEEAPNNLRSGFDDMRAEIIANDIPEVVTIQQNKMFSSQYFVEHSWGGELNTYAMCTMGYGNQYTGRWCKKTGFVEIEIAKVDNVDILNFVGFKTIIKKNRNLHPVFNEGVGIEFRAKESCEVPITAICRTFGSTFASYRNCSLMIDRFDNIILRYRDEETGDLIKELKIYHVKNVDMDVSLQRLGEYIKKQWLGN